MKHNQRQKAIYSLLLLFALGILFNTQPVNAAGSLTIGKGKDCIKDREGTCVDKCEAPLQLTNKGGVKRCETDCPKDSFTYPDGSCCPTCAAPFKQDKVGCMKICINPCKFVNWENKCQTTCDKPFKKRVEKGITYCDKPCEGNKYFWEQGDDCQECLDDCLEGWECAKDKGIDICKPKCPNAKEIWSPKQKKCVTACPVGYDKETINKVPMCAEKCECGEYFWETGCDGGACVKVCPDGYECGKDATGLDICKPKCTGKDDTWHKEEGKCVCDCPVAWKKEKVNGVNVCNTVCQKGEFFWEECDGKGVCLCECPEGWVCGKGCAGADICVPKCTGKDYIFFKDIGKCVCECPKGWQIDQINSLPSCNPVCDKGQYFWAEGGKDGACVDKCPEGWECAKDDCGLDVCKPKCCGKDDIWFKEVGKCVCDCPAGWKKEKINEVNFCTQVCPKGEFFFEKCDDEGACLCECPDGLVCAKGFGGVDICAPKCTGKDFIWFKDIGKCVCECPKGWAVDKVNGEHTCNPVCDKNQYFWAEGGKDGACVDKCPEGWECGKDECGLEICKPICCGKENVWLEEEGKCVCDCPVGFQIEKINKVDVCSPICGKGEFFWEGCDGKGSCVCACPDGWTCGKGCFDLDICVPKCTGKDFIWFKDIGKCVCECPKGWAVDKVNGQPTCNPVCDKNQFFWADGGKDGACVDKCPEGWECGKDECGLDICKPRCCGKENVWLEEEGKCVCDCPAGFSIQKINKVDVCAPICGKGEFFWEGCDGKGSCVCACPDGWICGKGCFDLDICVPKCIGKDFIWFKDIGKCVCECPKGWAVDKVNGQPTCNPVCDKNQYFWAEGGKDGACVDNCPEGWECGKDDCGLDVCKPKCCGKDDIWFKEVGKCVCDCPAGWKKEKINEVNFCTKVCPKGEFFFEKCDDEGACLCECPDGLTCAQGFGGVDLCVPKCTGKDFIWFKDIGKCVCECPSGWLVDKVNGQPTCNPVCDKNQFWWAQGGKDGACVDKCPAGWQCAKDSYKRDICVPACIGKDNTWIDGKCVCDCPAGFTKEKVNKVDFCTPTCEKGEYFWAEGGKGGACVTVCPEGWECGQDKNKLAICKPKCDDIFKKIWAPDQNQCVKDCPCGWEKEKVNQVDFCRRSCRAGQVYWAEGGNDGICVDKCPEGWQCGKDKYTCEPICDPKKKEKIWCPFQKKCLSDCAKGYRPWLLNKLASCEKCDD